MPLKDEDVYIDARKIPIAHLRSVCKYRTGITTCKYITFWKDAFYCLKNVSEIKGRIDELKDMKAKSDNCGGL